MKRNEILSAWNVFFPSDFPYTRTVKNLTSSIGTLQTERPYSSDVHNTLCSVQVCVWVLSGCAVCYVYDVICVVCGACICAVLGA